MSASLRKAPPTESGAPPKHHSGLCPTERPATDVALASKMRGCCGPEQGVATVTVTVSEASCRRPVPPSYAPSPTAPTDLRGGLPRTAPPHPGVLAGISIVMDVHTSWTTFEPPFYLDRCVRHAANICICYSGKGTQKDCDSFFVL